MVVREGRADDLPFIYSTWLRGLYYGHPWYKLVDKETFFAKYKLIVMKLLSRSFVSVFCLRTDPDVVLGYAVYEGPVLHWVYVKKAWRQFGIATKLMPEGIDAVSHLTSLGRIVKPKEWKFDPFV